MNAFLIPHLLFGCLHYELATGEKFGNFEIRQPMTFVLNSHSLFHDSTVYAQHHCGEAAIVMPEYRIPLEGTKLYDIEVYP